MKRSHKVISIVAVSLLGVGLFLWSAIGNHYVVAMSDSHSFTIDMPFVSLRKILVQTNASSEIINAGEHSRLISVKTRNREGHINNILAPRKSWEGSEVRDLTLEISDPYIGTRTAPFTQHVSITPGTIDSVIQLARNEGPLLGYNVTTHIGGNANASQFNTTLEMKIDTPAPWFAHWFARMRVRSTMRRTLRAQEEEIRAAVEKHRGQF